MNTYKANKGLVADWLNQDFNELKQQSNNNNERIIALQTSKANINGSNITQSFIDLVNRSPINALNASESLHELEVNKRYVLDSPKVSQIFVLPPPILNVYSAIQLDLRIGAELVPINLGTTHSYQNLLFEGFEPNTSYSIEWIYDPNVSAWFWSAVKKVDS